MFASAFPPAEQARTWRMARALGLDLSGAVLDGWLNRQDLSHLIAQCGTCGKDGHCTDWLQHGHTQAERPEFCPNTPEFEVLSP